MSRKRKSPDPTEFDKARGQLWQWLVEHAGAAVDGLKGNPDSLRRSAIMRIQHEEQNSGYPTRTRAGAAAGAFLDLDLAAADRAAGRWYLNFRAETLDKAAQAGRAVGALSKSWRVLMERAEADRPDYPLAAYWPAEIAEKLASREVALLAAAALIEDYRNEVEKLGEAVWGADLERYKLRKMASVALRLSDGGFSAMEIADLLDETKDDADLKARRWQKHVEWARDALAGKIPKQKGRRPPAATKREVIAQWLDTPEATMHVAADTLTADVIMERALKLDSAAREDRGEQMAVGEIMRKMDWTKGRQGRPPRHWVYRRPTVQP